ncbi:hypothetical protein JKA74_13510 [Marivirga sp. S37H4]|uniref:Uncharacterized protein n=1 Tax=Marivirga aurantiaca TaxID=2802615 RepID=A0A934X092_9BACT|nr:hypothetical protein [Marivirga aurantiaca]MBK6266055.1 hypothetical protein [Marivirga aurantiaca]
MGIWDSFVEIVINLELKDYVLIVLGGASWDLVKSGTRKFFLRPLIETFKEFESKNAGFDYLGLTLKFQDTDIRVYGLEKLFTSRLGVVMPTIAKHYQKLLRDSQYPHTIFVPITYDNEQSKFVDYGDGEDFELEQYVTFWGISYDAFEMEQGVYDVNKSKLLSESFR